MRLGLLGLMIPRRLVPPRLLVLRLGLLILRLLVLRLWLVCATLRRILGLLILRLGLRLNRLWLRLWIRVLPTGQHHFACHLRGFDYTLGRLGLRRLERGPRLLNRLGLDLELR